MATDFGFNDILRLTGVGRSALTHWLDRGIIVPDISTSEGRGHGNRFSFRNAVEVALARILAERFAWAAIGAILRQLRDGGAWDKLSRRSTRASNGFLWLMSPLPASAADEELLSTMGPVPTTMSGKQAEAHLKKDLSAQFVNLDLLLSMMEERAGTEL